MKYRAFAFIYRNAFLLGLACILMLVGCVKEEITTDTTTTITPEPQELVITTIYGRVIDENNNPVADAQVSYKSGEAVAIVDTDEDGYFLLQDVRNKGKSAFLSVTKDGKFEAFRRMSVLGGRYNYTEIKMNNKTVIGQVDAAAGGTLSHPSGAEIALPAQGIVDAAGNLFSGNLEVAMAWIDPSANDLAQRMVGDLSGIDEAGQVRSLGTFGMLQVELLDMAGNELNLAAGTTATLVFPVPASMQENAPATIPLWSYDEAKGTWIQEGEATYSNGEYTGVVSHFSSWNVDCLNDPIEISGQVYWNFQNDTLLSGAYLSMYVCGEKFGQKGGWLCESGEFLFYNFPKDEVFDLKIYDPCGVLVYQETYGPYSEDTDLGTIEITTNSELVHISGNAVDCDGNPVTEGYASINVNDRKEVFPLAEDGTFSITINMCEGLIAHLSVFDAAAQLISEPQPVSATQSEWTFTDLAVCDELTDYLAISIDGGTPTIYTPDVVFVTNDSLSFIQYVHETQNGYVTLWIDFEEPVLENTPYMVTYFSYNDSELDNGYVMLNGDSVEITFTTLNNVPGGEIQGTFEGNITDESTGVSVPISGSFQVPID